MVLALVGLVSLALAQPAASAAGDGPAPIAFVGSSPFTPLIRELVGLPESKEAELIEWRLSLRPGDQAGSSGTFELRGEYGPAAANLPGLGRVRTAFERAGRWETRREQVDGSPVVVHVLDGVFALRALSNDVWHILDRNGRLLAGTAGWSFTLNRLPPAGPLAASRDDTPPPDLSYRLAPLATGSEVFGVFEGRTPSAEIARVLGVRLPPGSFKAKWRVTLFRDPATGEPTRYRVEGSLYRDATREGMWSIERGPATIYRLGAAGEAGDLRMLVGDDRVVFLVDAQSQPFVGNAHFSYTLHRR